MDCTRQISVHDCRFAIRMTSTSSNILKSLATTPLSRRHLCFPGKSIDLIADILQSSHHLLSAAATVKRFPRSAIKKVWKEESKMWQI
ncbi:hypothetical protein Y1Q_0012454 [Alligator mississippiensis]|nr:hypothetical protein Y1Q_0012454 [Alligator mississippiensis]